METLREPQPGHQVQVDVKFITPIGAAAKEYYQFTAIDDCTRIRVLRVYPRRNQKTAIQFLDYLLARLPFRVDSIQTDNGGEFGSQFHYHVLDHGVVIDDTKLFSDKLKEWEDFYNFNRPHGGLDGQTPYQRLKQNTEPDVSDQRQSHTLGSSLVEAFEEMPVGVKGGPDRRVPKREPLYTNGSTGAITVDRAGVASDSPSPGQ